MDAATTDLLVFERALLEGGEIVVGLDEVGRGALAGPLGVGAVVLSSVREPPEGLNDSKLLSRAQREGLEVPLRDWCDDWSVGWASAREIDRWGLRVALAVASTRAVDGLSLRPTYALIDGSFDLLSVSDAALPLDVDVPILQYRDLPCTSMLKGDRRSATIAAASVLAKVARDRAMVSLHEECATYQWSSNKGYGSAFHLEAIRRHGPHAQHRTSWNLPDSDVFDGKTKIVRI